MYVIFFSTDVTIHLIPSLPITDPFDHTTDSQVILRHLSFVTSQSNVATDSTTKEDSLRLVASFSRQETHEEGSGTVIEQLQAWDVRFQLSSLSTGFLSLESINDLRNHPMGLPDPSSSAPTDLLRGPVEWVQFSFVMLLKKKKKHPSFSNFSGWCLSSMLVLKKKMCRSLTESPIENSSLTESRLLPPLNRLGIDPLV
jgi:hypothetical protein